MNRHLGFLAHGSKNDFDTKLQLYHKHGAKKNELAEPPVDIIQVVDHWKKTRDKRSTLNMLGKVLRQINESHENDLLK